MTLKEAQRVYLRRDEEKTKVKAKILMVAVRETNCGESGEVEKEQVKKKIEGSEWIGRCFYCGERGHVKAQCKVWEKDRRSYQESQED